MAQEIIFCGECGGLRGCKDSEGKTHHCYWHCNQRRGCVIFIEIGDIAKYHALSPDEGKKFMPIYTICAKCRKEMRKP